MARSRVLDNLQSHRFFAIDVKPSGAPPFLAFLPIFGFQSISGIGVQVETEQFRPINSMYPRHFASGATVNPVTFTRGATIFDTDFYRWIERTINGSDQWRRNILVVQLTGFGVSLPPLPFPLPVEALAQVPGRAWLLWDCIPTSYDVGDMDAQSGEVSINTLEIQPRFITEVALGAPV